MTKTVKVGSSHQPPKGDFQSARAAVWRELTVVREAATGRFKESLIRDTSNTKVTADQLPPKK